MVVTDLLLHIYTNTSPCTLVTGRRNTIHHNAGNKDYLRLIQPIRINMIQFCYTANTIEYVICLISFLEHKNFRII